MGKRRAAREQAFKYIFQSEINDELTLENETPFTQQLVNGVFAHKEEIDQLIKDHLINWSFERISLVDKAILRIAIYEILFEADIPYAVSINEAVELARKYGDDASSKFINGLLSNIVKKRSNTNER